MRSLYLRIWLTLVAVLALFALVSGWLVQRQFEEQRHRQDEVVRERVGAWAELLKGSLPPADAPRAEQAAALREWSQRLRLPMALDDANGERIGASEAFQRREEEGRPGFLERTLVIRLDDGRTLRVPRAVLLRGSGTRGGPGGPGGMGPRPPEHWPWLTPRNWPEGLGLVLLLALLFLAVALGAWPVVRRLTRRLEQLKLGVETFGAGQLHHRVAEEGRDEVAAVGASFNRAAARVEALVRSHQSLLANASHELRSPLARLKMALAMLKDAPPASRPALEREIDANIAELDTLVEEVLMSSRLDAAPSTAADEPVELLALAAEEAARVDAAADGESAVVRGDERLLRRALRNLLENGRRYGGDGELLVEVRRLARGAAPPAGAAFQAVQAGPAGAAGAKAAASLAASTTAAVAASAPAAGATSAGPAAHGWAEVRICDRGAGVPAAQRERIFEPFYRMPGHAERAGGVGLGLSLVRQIAQRHGGSVHCEPREGGGSCFVLKIPLAGAAA